MLYSSPNKLQAGKAVLLYWSYLGRFRWVVLLCSALVLHGYIGRLNYCVVPPQWGAADAEIKVPSGENTYRA